MSDKDKLMGTPLCHGGVMQMSDADVQSGLPMTVESFAWLLGRVARPEAADIMRAYEELHGMFVEARNELFDWKRKCENTGRELAHEQRAIKGFLAETTRYEQVQWWLAVTAAELSGFYDMEVDDE